VDQQRTHFAEGAELLGILKPPSGVSVWGGSRVWNAPVRNFRESCLVEERLPFSGA
jgi:hypothetical protein